MEVVAVVKVVLRAPNEIHVIVLLGTHTIRKTNQVHKVSISRG